MVTIYLASDDAAEQRLDGVTVVAVELRSGFRHPDNGAPVDGQVLTVPMPSESVVVAASSGEQLAVRLGTEAAPGPWIRLRHQPDEAPDRNGIAAAPGIGEGPDGGPRALPPLLIDAGVERLEVLSLGGSSEGITAAFLGPSDLETTPAVAGVQQLGPSDVLVVPRANWIDQGWASTNSGCSTGPWYADNLQAIVIHHTVTGNNYSSSQVDDLLRAIHYGHVEVNGWCDIGYNFVVDRFGTVWEARSGGSGRPVIGGHAKGFNTGTVGVALLGQHQQGARPSAVAPSAAANAAVVGLAQWKLGLYGVDPQGTTWLKNRSGSGPQRLAKGRWHRVPTVLSHRDLGLTSCPGNLTLALVHNLGPTLQAENPADLAYRFDDWTPYDRGPGFAIVGQRGEPRIAGSASLPGIGADDEATPTPFAPPSPDAVAIAAQGSAAGGYVLHRDGVLHPFGSAPAVVERPAGEQTAVDVAVARLGDGGWVISAEGGVHGFGGRPDLAVADAAFSSAVIAGGLGPAGQGYLLDATGRLRAVGPAPSAQIEPPVVNAVDVAVRPSGDSGWVAARDGRLHPFGGAPEVAVSSPGGLPADRQVKAAVASATGHGGWLLTDDGQLWPFGGERIVLPLATVTVGDDAVDVAFVGSRFSAEFIEGSRARYLDGLSRLFLGRSIAPEDAAYWDGWLTFRGGRRAVAIELARSPEWAGQSIEGMYSDVLGRPADAAGLGYWLDRVAEGMAIQDIGVYFYASGEYVTESGSTGDYVERLYDRLLGRPSDAAGRAYWVDLLESGRGRPGDVAAAFYSSTESRSRRVTALYQRVLGRGPDEAGSAYWVQRLGEVDDVILAAELAVSDEFYQLSLE